MSALQHLSPDVLEVVRDVARQEDSFLLRVQGVPLQDFISGRATSIRRSAAGLSKAERHLLAYGREELAYAIESALYATVTSQARSIQIAPSAVAGEFDELERSLPYIRGAGRGTWQLEQSGPVADLLTSVADRRATVSWRELARYVMALRVRVTTIGNVAFGHTLSGDHVQALASVLHFRSKLRGANADVLRVEGLANFNACQSHSASVAYGQSWRISGNVEDAACSALNAWLAQNEVPGDIEAYLTQLGDQEFASVGNWLRGALNAPLNRAGRDLVIRKLAIRTRSTSSQAVHRLLEVIAQ